MATKTNVKITEKDYYRVTLDLGRDVDGERIRKQFIWSSKKEAEQKKQDYLLKANLGIQDKTIFLAQGIKSWYMKL